MSYKLIAFCITAWLFIAILGSVFDGASTQFTVSTLEGDTSNSGSAINTVLTGKALTFVDIPFTQWELPMPNPGYFGAFLSLGAFNFSFFEGRYILVRWVLLAIVTGPLFFKLLELTLPSAMYYIGSIIGAFRRLLPFSP